MGRIARGRDNMTYRELLVLQALKELVIKTPMTPAQGVAIIKAKNRKQIDNVLKEINNDRQRVQEIKGQTKL